MYGRNHHNIEIHQAFNQWTHNQEKGLIGVLTHGDLWVTRSTAAQGTKRRKSWWLETGGFWDLNENNKGIEAKICTVLAKKLIWVFYMEKPEWTFWSIQ